MSKAALALVAILATLLAACEEAPLTAPLESDIFVVANPTFVVANGGVSVVTALVTETKIGTFVGDGTEVNFFTNLGRIDPVGKTVAGVARVNFVADSRSGVATVTAFSGATKGNEVTITVGSRLPKTVFVTADPPRVTSSRQSLITANVFDENGNPVQNVPIIFSVSATPLEETLDSGGVPQFTDSNGQAFDTMRTRAVLGGTQKRVTVTATGPTGLSDTVDVFVN